LFLGAVDASKTFAQSSRTPARREYSRFYEPTPHYVFY